MSDICNDQTDENVALDCATWPDAYQKLWMRAFAPEIGDPHWARCRQYGRGRVFTRYLECCERLSLPFEPSSEGVRAFIGEAEARGVRQRTLNGYIWAIWEVSRVVCPTTDLDWLLRSCKAIRRVADQSPKLKDAKIAEARAILDFALGMIREARAQGPKSWKEILLFRDGLFIVIGLLAPERYRALRSTQLSFIDFEAGTIRFPHWLVKGKRPSLRILPPPVMTLVCEWIAKWRSQLNPSHDYLWVTKSGSAPSRLALSKAMTLATAEAPWGHSISPHRLRDAAATFLTEISPEVARLASVILTHQSEIMTLNYVETAKRIAASRLYGEHLKEEYESLSRQLADTPGLPGAAPEVYRTFS